MGTQDKQFILQFKVQGHGTPQDLDRLVEIEEKLDSALQRNRAGHVDGHDIGSGTMNIFMFSPTWKAGEEFLLLYLRYQDWASQVVVAKRSKAETYEVIWPKDFAGRFEML
jgi:hypothetical protein